MPVFPPWDQHLLRGVHKYFSYHESSPILPGLLLGILAAVLAIPATALFAHEREALIPPLIQDQHPRLYSPRIARNRRNPFFFY